MSNITYIVNVEGAIYHEDKWLIIKRSELEEHASGQLSLVGGKVEDAADESDILEETLRREIKEEVGIEIENKLVYLESKSFRTDKLETVIDVVFLCRYKSGTAEPMNSDEVSEVCWCTAKELLSNDKAPFYLKDTITKAEKYRLTM